MPTVAGKGTRRLPCSYLFVSSSHATLWSGWDTETCHPRACPGSWTLAENAGTRLLAPLRNGMELKEQRWKEVASEVEKQRRVQSGVVSDAESE